MLFCPSKKHVAPFRERSETAAGGMDKSGFFKLADTKRLDGAANETGPSGGSIYHLSTGGHSHHRTSPPRPEDAR